MGMVSFGHECSLEGSLSSVSVNANTNSIEPTVLDKFGNDKDAGIRIWCA